MDHELTRSKETKRNLCDKWHQLAAKSMDQLRRLKDLKDTNRLLNESLQRKTDELNEVLAVKHRLDEMVIRKYNALNISRSQLEKAQHENHKLWYRVRRLE